VAIDKCLHGSVTKPDLEGCAMPSARCPVSEALLICLPFREPQLILCYGSSFQASLVSEEPKSAPLFVPEHSLGIDTFAVASSGTDNCSTLPWVPALPVPTQSAGISSGR